MKVEVETREGKRNIEISSETTGEDLLRIFGLLPDSALIIVDGKALPFNERIKGKKIKIINVATGG